MTHRILILGATSAIAEAYARRRAADGCAIVLAGRHETRLAAIAADLLACGASSTDIFVVDLAAMDRIEISARDLRRRLGEPDEIVLSYGTLGVQDKAELDLSAARDIIDTNFTSAALWVLALLKDRALGAPLTLVGIGSVAGDRGRASNFIYGSAKGAFDRFFQGLSHKYAGTAVRIILVKPGFVDTPMTAGMAKSGVLWATPDRVASDIHRAIIKGRRVVYTPWFWWPIMMVIRHLPWFVFRRLGV